ncbi:glycerol-3-phosphate 1-O-acyltransferase PlsY [Bacteroidales bacterium OttesenSCG-928-I21]|nr:glycerol-3-phosphate 1-O-acyltransferase PlsY [Bacteroidales bacterium OttesenSCG-928-I21]
MIYYIIIFSILSYLIGSFSSALWYGKWLYNIDIRKVGSGNAGATNMLRTKGWAAAILVFVTDMLKSFLSAQFVRLIPEVIPKTEIFYQLMILFGICAVIGHILPLYSGFKGGKGVASILGVILALHPLSAGLSLLMFIIVFLPTHIVSLSSISAAIAFPIIMYVLEQNQSSTLLVFSIMSCALILVTHRNNIKRLMKGKEKKINFRKS